VSEARKNDRRAGRRRPGHVSAAFTPITRRAASQAITPKPMPIEVEPLVFQPIDPMVLAVETIAAPMPLNIRPIAVAPVSLQ
jgi:hypothetical protein